MDAQGRADKFDGLYWALKEKVESQEQVQASQDPIHSQAEAVKRQMEQHKVSRDGLYSQLAVVTLITGSRQPCRPQELPYSIGYYTSITEGPSITRCLSIAWLSIAEGLSIVQLRVKYCV